MRLEESLPTLSNERGSLTPLHETYQEAMELLLGVIRVRASFPSSDGVFGLRA